MGLSKDSVGMKAAEDLRIHKKAQSDLVIALAGNPNVGKSTVFNGLTGMNQHTGNWPGKTVVNAQGYGEYDGQGYVFVDIPGCYSLMAHSAEEEVARDFICNENPDAVVVVCDATCLERNLNLVLQIINVTENVVVCVNLMDEARKKNIHIDIRRLENELGVPVISMTARKKNEVDKIYSGLKRLFEGKNVPQKTSMPEGAGTNTDKREKAVTENECIVCMETETLEEENVAESFVLRAEEICKAVVRFGDAEYTKKDRRLDKLFTSKLTGFPIMFLLLMLIFWITITGANYPSELLSNLLFSVEDSLAAWCVAVGVPKMIYEPLLFGMYRVLAWVVSVMLPPMAIFFPLFTLLEDFGYLPRVAFNLDRCFKKCRTCGKQALSMAMGFGCNAAGVVGCRIIDSERERIIAMLTNSFVPCNGRFPTMISIISMFLIGGATGFFASFGSAAFLAGIIVFGILMTFLVSRLLSRTILKGTPSSFTMELPPYRRPQIIKVLIRSLVDRALFVLGRAVVVAAPTGLVIWLLANIEIGEITLLSHCSGFLDPFARLLGMDGVILLAFILGFPANEIVIPIIIMCYMAQGSLMKIDDVNVLKNLLVDNGWTWITAVSTILFSLMHWPCSTTCLTIKKESQSIKWTVLGIVIPTAVGTIVCFIFTSVARLIVSII